MPVTAPGQTARFARETFQCRGAPRTRAYPRLDPRRELGRERQYAMASTRSGEFKMNGGGHGSLEFEVVFGSLFQLTSGGDPGFPVGS